MICEILNFNDLFPNCMLQRQIEKLLVPFFIFNYKMYYNLALHILKHARNFIIHSIWKRIHSGLD